MAEHSKAFDKGTDADKLKATSEQYQSETGQADKPETGPDPIIEATQEAEDEAREKAEENAELDLGAPANPEYEEEFAQEPVEGAESEGGDSVPNQTDVPEGSSAVPTAGTTTQEAESRKVEPKTKAQTQKDKNA